jgi:hypothetical protein
MRNPRDGLVTFNGPLRRGKRRRGRSLGTTALRFVALVLAGVAAIGIWVLVSSLIGGDPVHLKVEGMEGEPVAGAVVTTEGGGTATTDEEGAASLRFGAPQRLSVVAPGYRDATYLVEEIPRQGSLSLKMSPHVLQGRITDNRGNGLVGATIEIDGKSTESQEFGAYEITAVEPGPVVVSKAAWEPTEVVWPGGAERFDVALSPFVVRGLRVHSPLAGGTGVMTFDQLLSMIEGTVINTLVFDTKTEDGRVTHAIDVPAAYEARAVHEFYDAVSALEEAERRGLYTITRIVTFQDPFMAVHRPEWGIRDSATGDLWRNTAGLAWLDPTNTATWQYPIDLAVEACRLGFDEIQFDYVRFPSDGDISTASYSMGPMDASTRVETIAAFLQEARDQIHPEGCAVSADIFGIVLSVDNEQGIGQKVEELSWVTDVLSPMVYPSHYGRNWLGFENPNNHPGAVVGQALDAGMPRLEGGALMRPWLQAFSCSTEQIRESIAAAERVGSGWMLWNSTSAFERDWLPRAGG